MLDFGESPNVAVESSLLSIVEEDAPRKFYLSAKACEGIIRRTDAKGKPLPEPLRLALKEQIERAKRTFSGPEEGNREGEKGL